MRLEAKLGLSSGIVVLAILLSSAAAYFRITEANRISASLMDEQIPAATEARSIRSHIANSLRAEESLMLFGIDPASSALYRNLRRDTWQATQDDYARLFALNARYDLGAAAGPILDLKDQLTALGQMQQQVETLLSARSAAARSAALALMRGPMAAQAADLDHTLDKVLNIESARTQRQTSDLESANRSMLFALGFATLVAIVARFGFSLLIGGRISRSIRMVAGRANAIATGDLTGAPLEIHSTDEIGALALAMHQMQTNLREILGTVVTTAGTLTSSAISMDSASSQIHTRMDLQSQQTEQAAAAMQEMSATVAEVSRHAHDAAQSARSAVETAREGGGIVQQMLGSMHSIASAVSETSTTIGLLGEDSGKISHIVSVIEEIAQKTNLLALNAAIEAARAGDQGRGFAVVAGEVRRLAESTARATSEIATMIQGIQQRTRTAIAGMHGGTLTVEQGMATTNRAGEALERIIGMAERVDRMIAQIAVAASQQAVAADQSSSSLDSIHSLSNENLEAMRTTAVGIESLRSTALALEHQIDRFRIQGISRTAPQSSAPMPQTSGPVLQSSGTVLHNSGQMLQMPSAARPKERPGWLPVSN